MPTALAVKARHGHRYARSQKAEAEQQVASDRATSERDAGEGSVTVEGDTSAVPDGLCMISGARSGVDGAWRIDSVTHSYSRGGGFVTALELKAAQGGASSGVSGEG